MTEQMTDEQFMATWSEWDHQLHAEWQRMIANYRSNDQASWFECAVAMHWVDTAFEKRICPSEVGEYLAGEAELRS